MPPVQRPGCGAEANGEETSSGLFRGISGTPGSDLAIGQACSQPKESLFCVFYAFTSRRALVETLIGVDLFVSKHLVLVSLPALLSFCSCQKFRQVSLTDTSPPVGVSGAATTSSVSAAPARFSRGVTTTLQSATAFCVHIQAYFLFHLLPLT